MNIYFVPGSGPPPSVSFACLGLRDWGTFLSTPSGPTVVWPGRGVVLPSASDWRGPPTGGESVRARAKSLPPKCLLGVERRPEPTWLHWTNGTTPAGSRRPLLFARSRISTLLLQGCFSRLPELYEWSAVSGRPAWRLETEVLPGGVRVVARWLSAPWST